MRQAKQEIIGVYVVKTIIMGQFSSLFKLVDFPQTFIKGIALER